jgi:inner membrane protein YhjD
VDRLTRFKAVRVLLAVNDRYGKDGGNYLAASLTYHAFLSIFPLILVALAAIGLVLANDAAARAQWAGRLSGSVPGIGPLVSSNIEAIVRQRNGAGVLGLLGLVWSGTGLTNAAGYALSRVIRRPEPSGMVRKRLWSLSATAGLGLLALATVAVSGFAGGLRGTGVMGAGLTAAALLVSFVLDAGLFAVSYRVLTPGPGPGFRRLLPGASGAAAGWTALKVAGAWYAARTVGRASEVYGTFGTVIGVLALLYLAARLFLYGAELNAVLAEGSENSADAAFDTARKRLRGPSR